MRAAFEQSDHHFLREVLDTNAVPQDDGSITPAARPRNDFMLVRKTERLLEAQVLAVVPRDGHEEEGLAITRRGIQVLSLPHLVGHIGAVGPQVGIRTELVGPGLARNTVLYAWSDGVVTWTPEREFPDLDAVDG